MNIFCGTDIIEISRVKESILNKLGNKFVERVFTTNEIEYCESKKEQKYQHYAGRFASKEAIFKAISYKLENNYNIEWNQIEILNDNLGRPFVILHHEISSQIEKIDLSISHCREYAVASVVASFK